MRYAHVDKSTGRVLGWLDTESFNYAALPSADTLVEVTDEQYEQRAKPMHFKDGALVDGDAPKPKPTTPDAAALAAQVRTRRNALLAESDRIVLRALEEGTPVPPEWKAYRQKLRDLTDAKKFPKVAEKDWPAAPAEPE